MSALVSRGLELPGHGPDAGVIILASRPPSPYLTSAAPTLTDLRLITLRKSEALIDPPTRYRCHRHRPAHHPPRRLWQHFPPLTHKDVTACLSFAAEQKALTFGCIKLVQLSALRFIQRLDSSFRSAPNEPTLE
ncbi:hypothetical protein [Synechococcus sp. RedBA-s]|uniref:hypothetical protein n=1 Tax=Synechococcus sp. RedBA-s TaxID=2823741 RepID=UPI0020CF2169|nr:hypothetical protein [Synechococcus sp. RedBA-s]